MMQDRYHGQEQSQEDMSPASLLAGHQHDGDVNPKTSSDSEAGVRKLTLSCSRCRASKLKCDRKEPCMECVKRNVGHLCTKDERQPRAKRVKTDHNDVDNTKTNASQTHGTEAEETAQVLEHFVDAASRTSTIPSAGVEQISPSIASDYPNMFWWDPNEPQRQDEKLTLIREIVEVMPELEIIHHLYDVFVTRCQGALGNVTHTPTFMKQAEQLYGCLVLASADAQVIALSSTLSMDTLACLLLALRLALAFHPTPALLNWSPTPMTLRVEELRASDQHSKSWRSLAVHCIRGGVSLYCGSIASLQASIMLLLDGHDEPLALDAILVTAISGAQKLGLHRLGDARFEDFAPPTFSSEDGCSTSTEPPHIRTETGIRIWWALVMRDWSHGQALGYYSIRPSQFNTRMPLHINDDDLWPKALEANVNGHVTERPRSEFTMLSYTVHALEIAVFARESIDLGGSLCQAQRKEETNEGAKMRNHLNKRYENFVAGLPAYFRLGSTAGLTSKGLMAAQPVHRWMLHQQLWSLLLRLHRGSLLSVDSRASCQLLAQNIISTQAQIQARCTVCGCLSISDIQLFSAAIVLVIDLLFSLQHKNVHLSNTQLNRLMIRDKIREAIELLRTRSRAGKSPSLEDLQSGPVEASAQRSIMTLEALMELEEEGSGNNEVDRGARLRRTPLREQGLENDSSAWKPLKKKVIYILEALQGNVKTAAAATERTSLISSPDMSMSFPTAAYSLQELDVLPGLSNDSSSTFWQYLDFAFPPQSPSQYGSFSATADSQSQTSSMPFTQSSAVAHSSINVGTTQDPADVYSNTGGSRISHTSPSSIESAPTKMSKSSAGATNPSRVDAHLPAEFYHTLEDDTLFLESLTSSNL